MALRHFKWEDLGNKQRSQYGPEILIWGNREKGTTKRENVGLGNIKCDSFFMEMKSRQASKNGAKLDSNKLERSGAN